MPPQPEDPVSHKSTTFPSHLISLAILFISLSLLSSGCASRIIRVADRTEVLMPELVSEMKKVRLVFIGEAHDEEWHHETQLALIKALHESGSLVAVGIEMFRAENQSKLDQWVSGGMDEAEFVKEYSLNWQVPWPKYSGIFLYARDNRIPLVGLNIPKKVIRQVFKDGYESLTPEQLKEVPGAKCEVDAEYEKFIRRAMSEHTMSDSTFKKFCEAQMVWDSSMALKSIDYLKANQEKTLVVLAGSAHSWRRGIPNQVKKLQGPPYVIILPESVMSSDISEITVDDTDYVWVGSFADLFK